MEDGMEMILHVQNLPRVATTQDLRQFFDAIDLAVNSISIIGGPNGDAFISFYDKSALLRALDLDGNMMFGKRLTFLLATNQDVNKILLELEYEKQQVMMDKGATTSPDGAPWEKRPRYDSPSSASPYEGPHAGPSHSQAGTGYNQAPIEPVPGYVVIYQLNPTITARDLRGFFKGLEIPHDGIVMRGSEDELSTVNAYIKFSYQRDSIRAECMNAEVLQGQEVQIDLISKTQWEDQKFAVIGQGSTASSSAAPSLAGSPSSQVTINQPIRASPFMAMFESNPYQTQCYLGLWSLPEKVSACDIWSWYGGASSPALGVTLGMVPKDHSMSMAFVVFRNVKQRNIAKTIWKASKNYSAQAAHRFLAELDHHSPIYISTTHGQDFELTRKERQRLSAATDVNTKKTKEMEGENGGMEKVSKMNPVYTVASDVSRNWYYIYIPRGSLFHSVTACQLWSIFAATNKCLGVTLIRDQQGQAMMAYAAFDNVQERQQVLQKQKERIVSMKSVNYHKALKKIAREIKSNKVVSESTVSSEERFLDSDEKTYMITNYAPQKEDDDHTLADDQFLTRQADLAVELNAKKDVNNAANLLANPPIEGKGGKVERLHYLVLTKVFPGCSACSLQELFGGECVKMILVCDEKGSPHQAFAGFRTASLAISMNAKYPYSHPCGNIDPLVANIDPNWAIWTNSESGQDQLMTANSRNAYKYRLLLRQELHKRIKASNMSEGSNNPYKWTKNTNRAYAIDKETVIKKGKSRGVSSPRTPSSAASGLATTETESSPTTPTTATATSSPDSTSTTTTPTAVATSSVPSPTETEMNIDAKTGKPYKNLVVRNSKGIDRTFTKPAEAGIWSATSKAKSSVEETAPPETELLPPIDAVTSPTTPTPRPISKKIKVNIPSFGVKK